MWKPEAVGEPLKPSGGCHLVPALPQTITQTGHALRPPFPVCKTRPVLRAFEAGSFWLGWGVPPGVPQGHLTPMPATWDRQPVEPSGGAGC